MRATIAIVSDSIYPYHKGGKETRLHYLSLGLIRAGYDVHFYTMKWWDGPSTIRKDGATLHAISRNIPLYNGERRSIVEGLLFGLATFKLLGAHFDVLETDHIPFFPLYSARIVCWLKRRPLHATWHEVWGRPYWGTYLGRFSGLVAAAIERYSVNLPNKIVAVSPMTAERLVDVLHCRRPITIIGNGIDDRAIAQAHADTTHSSDVIYTGRLLAHKNVDQLISAIGIITRTRPAIRCIIVGDGPERSRLQTQIDEAGLDKNVVLLGRIASDRKVMSIMKSSRVFVLPSVREGYGITLIEAMACGLPVVTSNHPDNAGRLLVDKTNGIVCAPSAVELAKSIEHILDQPDSYQVHLPVDAQWSGVGQRLAETYV